MAKKPSNNKKNRKGKSDQRRGKSFDFKKKQQKKQKKKKKKISPNELKQAAVDKQLKNPEAGMRLNKYISNSGVCSRRDADIYIASGNVTVNGEVITQMGYKVQLTDDVRFDGRRLTPVKKEYVLLNKPSGFYVTGSLERENRTVMDLVATASRNKIVPVGSLETSAKGLLLFTNDGTLEKKLARKGVQQIFHIELNKELEIEHLYEIREGVSLKEGIIKPIEVDYVKNKNNRHVGMDIISTEPQIVQKIFTKMGYEIVELDRVTYGDLTKKDLPRGRFRHLTKQEVINLGML